MESQVIKSISEWKELRKSFGTKTLGFIPTMGALHEGHESLFAQSLKENDLTVGSIFVNPTQFNDPKDFENYPLTFNEDLERLSKLGVPYLFYPTYKELYPDAYRYQVSENTLSKILCGTHRPGHFEGVLTVVLKLLNIIGATRAYFGEKDYQQYLLIKDMAQSFFHPTEILSCPTLRDSRGLALSSRNRRLSPEGHIQAAFFAKLLCDFSKTCDEICTELKTKGFKIDYIEEHLGRRFGAVFCEGVRLIDNCPLPQKTIEIAPKKESDKHL